MILAPYERRECPPEFAERVREAGGLNRFGGANFRIIWGETKTSWIGGMWPVTTVADAGGEIARVPEMRECLEYGFPAWILERWYPPEAYGSEENWYAETRDPLSRLPLLGPYPDAGYYEMAYKLTVDGFPVELTDEVIDELIPLVLKGDDVGFWIKRAYVLQREEAKAAEWRAKVFETYMEKAPFGGPISYRGQQNRTARMDRTRMERVLSRLPGGRGFRQLN